MVNKRPVKPFDTSSDSDDPLDVIGPSAPPSPPIPRPRSTPARPPPLTIKRTTPSSAKYTPRHLATDSEEDLPQSASRSSFAKRRRVLSDSEEEAGSLSGSPKNLARFVADLPAGTNGSGVGRDGSLPTGDATLPSVPRPRQRTVILSESEEEDAGPALTAVPLRDDEDAFGLFTAERSSSPAQHQISDDEEPVSSAGEVKESTDESGMIGDAQRLVREEQRSSGIERLPVAEVGEQNLRAEPSNQVMTDSSKVQDSADRPEEDGQDQTTSDREAIGAASDVVIRGGTVNSDQNNEIDNVLASDGRNGDVDEEPTAEEMVDAGDVGTDRKGIPNRNGAGEQNEIISDKSDDHPMIYGLTEETDISVDRDTIGSQTKVDQAVSMEETNDMPASDKTPRCAQDVIIGKDVPVSSEPCATGILDVRMADENMDDMESGEDQGDTRAALEIAGPVTNPDLAEAVTQAANTDDKSVDAPGALDMTEDERMESASVSGVSPNDTHGQASTADEAISDLDSTLAIRPILPQTPQSIATVTATQPVSSLSALPDHSSNPSPAIKQNGSAVISETIAESVVADDAEGEEEQEGEEEIDPDDIEMDEDHESESKPSEPEPPVNREKSESTSTAAEARETPVPVLLNSKGLPRGKPGRKPGWKVGDPLIKERKAMEARAKLGLDKEPVKGGKKGKVEALKSAARGRSVSFSETSEPASIAVDTKSTVSEADDNGDDDDTIYCSCGKESRADGNDTLVGCDGCDSWFHAGCVGLSEDEIELVDTFFCTSCEKATGQKTTMKKVCKRSGCDKQFANRQSKFCSSACAFQHSQSLIATMQNKKQLQQLVSALAHYPPPPPDIRIIQHLSSPSKTFGGTTLSYNPIEDLERRIAETQGCIDNLEKRILISGQAIEACETLPPLNIPNGEESSKKKRKPGGGDDRPCGWVEALIWADEEVGRWESGMPITSAPVVNGEDVDMENADAVGEYCMNPRKRCDRHSGWRMIIPESFGKELSQAQVLLASLVMEKDNLVEADKVKKAGKIARDSLHELLALRLAKTVV